MANTDPSAPASASERLLQELQASVRPGEGAADRIRSRIMRRVTAPELLSIAREAIQPGDASSQRVWSRVSAAFAPGDATLWDRVRGVLTPSADSRATVWSRIASRLQPPRVATSILISRPIKWVAAFTILLFVVRASPMLFLAPPTVAESSVTVLPSDGAVSVLIGGLWQPLQGELTLRSATMLQTHDGEATIVLHDDAVLRMGPHTTIALNDFADRPAAPVSNPTVFLEGGKLWVLGLVPGHLDGISIGTAEGRTVVHEGSISIVDGDQTDVRAWHRSAVATRRGQQLAMVAGEQVTLGASNRPLIGRIPAGAYEDAWVTRNLAMDAVHQREIALMQQERRAASAGILPTSTLYPAKRLAEAVDVLFTLNPEERARKQITHANTRLNEAAKLIATGGTDAAQEPLREYRETMLAVASGATVNPAVESILEQEVVAVASAELSAALPDDSSYALKQTVRETIAALPDGVEKPDTQAAQILDKLTLLQRQIDEGEVQAARVDLEKLKLELPPLDAADSGLSPELRKEVDAALATVVAAIEAPAEPAPQVAEAEVSRATSRTLRTESRSRRPTIAPSAPLSEDQIDVIVTQIRNRIVEGYDSHEGRQNQLQIEMRRLNGNIDEGRILRKLAHALPDIFGSTIRSRIREVAEKKAIEPLGADCTGSGC